MNILVDLFAPVGNQVNWLIMCDTNCRGEKTNQAQHCGKQLQMGEIKHL